MKMAFLILHYYTIEDTIKCIKSIKENMGNLEYTIVVVDNGSLNESGKKLAQKYEKDPKVHILINKENLGFSKGNNIGFKYIKEHFQPDFIVMLNNDTVLLQKNFYSLVIDEYAKSSFAVLGPKILLPNNKINPVQEKLPTVKSFKRTIFKMKIFYLLHLFYMYPLYEKIKFGIKKRSKKDLNFSLKNYNENVDKRQENVVLHGCFLIFSKKYMDKFDGLDDQTFLYMEEKILQSHLLQNKMLSVYNPNIVIYHNEDSSTKTITKTRRKKELFILKNANKSAKILLKELKKMGD